MTKAAIHCLGKVAPLQNYDAIAVLLTFFTDEDYAIQFAAGQALIQMEAYRIESVKRRLVELFAYINNLCFDCFYKDGFFGADKFEKQVLSAMQAMMEHEVHAVRLIALETITSASVARFRASRSLVRSVVARSLTDPARDVRREAVAALSRISKWADGDALDLFAMMASAAFNDANEQVAFALMETIHEVAGADDQRTLVAATAFLEIQRNCAARAYLESLQQPASCCNTRRRNLRRKGSQRRCLPSLNRADDEVTTASKGGCDDDGMKKVFTCAMVCFNTQRHNGERVCINRSKVRQLYDNTKHRQWPALLYESDGIL
jgi:hypothetical protein